MSGLEVDLIDHWRIVTTDAGIGSKNDRGSVRAAESVHIAACQHLFHSVRAGSEFDATATDIFA